MDRNLITNAGKDYTETGLLHTVLFAQATMRDDIEKSTHRSTGETSAASYDISTIPIVQWFRRVSSRPSLMIPRSENVRFTATEAQAGSVG